MNPIGSQFVHLTNHIFTALTQGIWKNATKLHPDTKLIITMLNLPIRHNYSLFNAITTTTKDNQMKELRDMVAYDKLNLTKPTVVYIIITTDMHCDIILDINQLLLDNG